MVGFPYGKVKHVLLIFYLQFLFSDDKASWAKQTNLITNARRVIKSTTLMFFSEKICERKSGLTLQHISKCFNLIRRPSDSQK